MLFGRFGTSDDDRLKLPQPLADSYAKNRTVISTHSASVNVARQTRSRNEIKADRGVSHLWRAFARASSSPAEINSTFSKSQITGNRGDLTNANFSFFSARSCHQYILCQTAESRSTPSCNGTIVIVFLKRDLFFVFFNDPKTWNENGKPRNHDNYRLIRLQCLWQSYAHLFIRSAPSLNREHDGLALYHQRKMITQNNKKIQL